MSPQSDYEDMIRMFKLAGLDYHDYFQVDQTICFENDGAYMEFEFDKEGWLLTTNLKSKVYLE